MQSLPIWPKTSAHSLIIALVITWVVNRQVDGLLARLRVYFFADHSAARASFDNPDQVVGPRLWVTLNPHDTVPSTRRLNIERPHCQT